MDMGSKDILTALKTGAISIEDAASKILKVKKLDGPKIPLEKSCDEIPFTNIAGGYHKVVLERPGDIDDLRVVVSDVPAMGRHEIRIAVKAFSLNFADLLCVRGLYPNMPPYPFTPGLEVSGIVARVGEGVKSFQPGDPVIAMAGKPLGGHATQLTCPAEQVFLKPESLSFEEATALPIVAITMLVAFEKANVQWGERVLIQTATGGTGLMAVQLAKYYGATLFATAGSDPKLKYLETLNVPYRINYQKRDFEKEIHRLTGGKGVDVVINTLPGDAIQKGLNCLSPEGRYIELAMTGIKSAKAIDLSVLNNNQTFYSIDPGRLKRPEILRSHFSEMIRLANQRILQATICKTFSFNEIKDAYRYLENRQNIGKIVVTIPDEYAYTERPTLARSVTSAKRMDSGEMDDRSVAIIGMSGRFAGAEDINRFWDNLARGKNSIREVPEWRWNLADSAGAGHGGEAQAYWKRGGFLDDIDKFDPLFFNISPAEAEYMDPQQRLFLEESWKTLEDAGVAPHALSGRKCGVFVGVGKGDYLGGRAGSWEKVNANRLMGTAPSILAARISYLLNLTGPSIAIDTACSSSLVAIYQACQSIVNGDCEMALAGGVCLLTTQELLIMAGKAGMLSPTGQCRTFDNGADGFVTGEGVGVILLKPLLKAIQDGDRIQAVIRGGGFNQDGRTNGITAPSAKSQVKLEKEVYDRLGIDPRSISYVEAHGTGTKLGDPIEISALSEVFRQYTDKKQYCAIGSVKTNIGHTLAAAGVASVIKVALALTHKQIPPSINFSRENEHIHFGESPFFVNTELRAWKAQEDNPLRAAVSSFGFSGTNVHMIIDGHQDENTVLDTPDGESRPEIFVLSAKNRERLKAYAQKMVAFLAGYPHKADESPFRNGASFRNVSETPDSLSSSPPMEKGARGDVDGPVIQDRFLNIADMAYTSQVGRQAMTERLAVLATSVETLREKLKHFAAGDDAIEGVCWGRAERQMDVLLDPEDAYDMNSSLQLRQAIQKWVESGDGAELMSLWVSGVAVDWHGVCGRVTPRRINLPTYPFERERYWMVDDEGPEPGSGFTSIGRDLPLHPLLHENTSDLTEQRFSATLTGDEFFLRDHLIGGKRTLPGAAYLEMARIAVIHAAAILQDGQATILFKNVVWARPIIVGEVPVRVHIGLFPEESGGIAYEIYSYPDEMMRSGDHQAGDTPPRNARSGEIGSGNINRDAMIHSCGVALVYRSGDDAQSPDMVPNLASPIKPNNESFIEPNIQSHTESNIKSPIESKIESTIESIKARCPLRKGHEALYGTLENEAAPFSFMCIRELFLNDNRNNGHVRASDTPKDEGCDQTTAIERFPITTEALALLELPSHLNETFGAYGLHPSLLNGVFETAIFGLHPDIAKGATVLGLFEKGEATIPYSLGEMEIVDPVLPKKCYAHAVQVRDGDVKVFNIRLLDISGRLLARLDHFAARSLSPSSSLQPHLRPDEKAQTPILHPMIDQDISAPDEPQFIKRFKGEEFYFTDHVVADKKMMPGVAYLEMVRAAVSHVVDFNAKDSGGAISDTRKPGIVLKNIVWPRPMVWEKEALDVHIRLFPRENESGDKASGENREMEYEIFTQPAGGNHADGGDLKGKDTGDKNRWNSHTGGAWVHSRGVAGVALLEVPTALDIPSIKAQCTTLQVGADACYAAYEKMGISYGPGHKGIETLYIGDDQLLARLALPASVFDQGGQFTLHPGLMDSALQAAIGFMIRDHLADSGLAGSALSDANLINSGFIDSGNFKPSVPFALESIAVYAPCPSTLWAHIRSGNNDADNHGKSVGDNKVQTLDIDVCDDSGRICARLRGYSSKAFKNPETETLLLKPSWRDNALDPTAVSQDYDQHIVVLCEPESGLASILKKAMKGVLFITLKSKKKKIESRFETDAIKLFSEIKKILQEKGSGQRIIQLVISENGENRLAMGLSGLLKSADLEHSNLVCQTILLSGVLSDDKESSDSIIQKLEENAQCPENKVICYQNDKRLVAVFEATEDVEMEPSVPWRDQGVYLITGGAGGLGLIFAKEIASRVEDPVIILTGRSKLDSERESLLKKLKKDGARVEYQQVDVRKKADVKTLIETIKKESGALHGIIHSAGIFRDNTIIKKTRAEFKAVLGPKVAGLVNLDEATQAMKLDLFIIFSSGAGALGNIGQADYACANAFMDAYAEYRDALVQAEKRFGKTLSINWPLWKSGGMGVDEETEKMMTMTLGTTALGRESGIRAFYNALALGVPRTLVVRGRVSKIRQKFLSSAVHAPDPGLHRLSSSAQRENDDASGWVGTVTRRLAADVSKMMKIPIEKIDSNEELGSYGFDSISLTELTNRLNQHYGLELPPTLFFEYPTLDGFATYLVDAYSSGLAAHFAKKSELKEESNETRFEPRLAGGTPVQKSARPRFVSLPIDHKKENVTATSMGAGSDSVAIVGISGKFPKAENVHLFWKNLEAGRHCIEEIPADRWDWRRVLGDGQQEEKTAVKWGGFIDGVKDFDPVFFSISPREAELMDPQQRLMMLYVWKAMEDAGIAPKALSQKSTGVFISPGMNEYMHLPSFPKSAPYAPTGIAISAIPNRISYTFNLHGPSEYCETSCSSALVALHRGIASIRMGECEQAIIGAVNLLLSPDGFNGVDAAYGHLSPSGEPRSFQVDADGYVRSEGIGAMIIKPLGKAIEENDRIYAVIKGTGVAHGGKGMSLTAPTGRGMKAAMVQAYRNSGVSPETISYIEAHGTATPMGDAIEINTLKSGYREISEKGSVDPTQVACQQGGCKKGPVYISSLKPCIGHGEIVSGMAALIKVVMALKHQTIPGLPRFKELNENISLDGSRFEISPENHPWEPLMDENGHPLPRRAAINSYGFGGVNAHAIIEEYVEKRATPEKRPDNRDVDSRDTPIIFVLSARDPERLTLYAEKMAKFLKNSEVGLQDIAYTLQIGREAMAYRLAIIATRKAELLEKLEAFIGSAGNKDHGKMFATTDPGNPESRKDRAFYINAHELPPTTNNESLDMSLAINSFQINAHGLPPTKSNASLDMAMRINRFQIDGLPTEKDLENIADAWVRGCDVPWDELYQDTFFDEYSNNGSSSDGLSKMRKPAKVSLPGYPFENRRCWIDIFDGVEKGGLIGDAQAEGEMSADAFIKPAPGEGVRAWLIRTLCAMLGLAEDEIRPDHELGQLGLDSYSGVRLINRIKDAYDLKIPLERLLEYHTVEKLARYLTEKMNDGQHKINNIGIDSTKDSGKVDDMIVDAESTEIKADDAGVNTGCDEDLNLDGLSESELDRLLKQHISDE